MKKALLMLLIGVSVTSFSQTSGNCVRYPKSISTKHRSTCYIKEFELRQVQMSPLNFDIVDLKLTILDELTSIIETQDLSTNNIVYSTFLYELSVFK